MAPTIYKYFFVCGDCGWDFYAPNESPPWCTAPDCKSKNVKRADSPEEVRAKEDAAAKATEAGNRPKCETFGDNLDDLRDMMGCATGNHPKSLWPGGESMGEIRFASCANFNAEWG